jgi:hypothetical protein
MPQLETPDELLRAVLAFAGEHAAGR